MMTFKSVFRAAFLLFPVLWLMACTHEKQEYNLTILHTNDTHSQVEPLEVGKRDATCGGYARRMGQVDQMRSQNPDLILLDAGDFCQGTPYYNYYHGRIEIDAMNRMHYDAITLGNHEFDYGLDTLATVLEMAQFPIVCANYDFTGSPLEGIVLPYTVIKRSHLRIGVFGIGVNPHSLIAEKNFTPIKYLDPITSAQKVANQLRHDEKCDVVICLSHQGTYAGAHGQMSDEQLAAETQNIDVIIGAHTHKIVENHYVENLNGDSVLLTQTGKAGARIGEISLKIRK
jgi:5'-nucleotidase